MPKIQNKPVVSPMQAPQGPQTATPSNPAAATMNRGSSTPDGLEVQNPVFRSASGPSADEQGEGGVSASVSRVVYAGALAAATVPLAILGATFSFIGKRSGGIVQVMGEGMSKVAKDTFRLVFNRDEINNT